MSSARPEPPFALALHDREARLLDREGEILARVPARVDTPEARLAARETLLPLIHAGDRVDVVFASSDLDIQCQEVPFLGASEVREAGHRLASALAAGEACHDGAVLLDDPEADGGHVLWVGSFPARPLDDWLSVLHGLGASLRLAVPHSFIMLRAMEEEGAWPRELLVLGLDGAAGRVGFLRGRSLLFTRTFWLPEGLEAARIEDQDELLAILAEELGRVLQFVKQKYRGVSLETLLVIGLDALEQVALAGLGRALRLQVQSIPGGQWQLFARALARHRDERDLLNLMPRHVLEARRDRFLRRAAWVCAGGIALLGGLAWAGMGVAVSRMETEAMRAESAMARRRDLLAEKERVARVRFPQVRVRAAEGRQVESLESLDRLGLRLLEVPEGVLLESVEITQVPGEPLRWHFQVVGTALSRRALSLGPLARYLEDLRSYPDLVLSPLKDVTVSDREGLGQKEIAVTRFAVQGVAP